MHISFSSAYKANYQAASALLNTHISASTGSLTAVLLGYYSTKAFSLSKFIEGAFAGLACITAGSGYESAGCASITGCCGAAAAHFSIILMNK